MNAITPVAPELTRQASTDAQLIELWLHGRSPATAKAYRGDVDRFVTAVGRPLHSVTLQDLQAYADGLAAAELSTASRARMLASVKSLFAFAHKLGYLPFDVARVVRLPKVQGKLAERILSESQVLRMIGEPADGESEIDRRNRVLVLLAYAGGLRNSELVSLTWADTSERDEGGGQITVTGKGSKVRVVRLPAAVWSQLLTLRADAADADPILRSRERDGAGAVRALDQSQVNRIVHAFAQRAGIKKSVSPHWLRHAHASHAIERGAPIHLVQATLGHASVATTGRYLHARPGESSSRFLAVG